MSFDIPKDIKIWNQVEVLNATAKTAGTFNAFGSFTLRSGVKSIVGFYASVCDAKPTDAENSCAIIKVASDDLGIAEQTIIGPTLVADGDAAAATNSSKKIFYPYSPKIPGGIDKATITFSISVATSSTEGVAAGIQLVTANVSKIPYTLALAYLAGFPLPYNGMNHAEEDAGASEGTSYASWGTADADTIKVPAKASQLRMIASEIAANAVTSADPLLTVFKYECDDIPDFGPQEHLCGNAYDSILGTVINKGEGANTLFCPFVFPLPGKTINILISDKNVIASATATDGVASMGWV